jgi:hypothetical protein
MTTQIECQHGNRGEAREWPKNRAETESFATWWHESLETTVHMLAQLRTWDHPDWFAETYFEDSVDTVCCDGWYSNEDFSAKFLIVDE